MMARLPSGAAMPVNAPELISTSSSVCATYAPSKSPAPIPSRGATTWRTGSPNVSANSKSRSSWPGTAITAPVPYSIRT